MTMVLRFMPFLKKLSEVYRMIFITHDFVLFMHLSYYLPDSKLSIIFYTTTHLKSALYWNVKHN